MSHFGPLSPAGSRLLDGTNSRKKLFELIDEIHRRYRTPTPVWYPDSRAGDALRSWVLMCAEAAVVSLDLVLEVRLVDGEEEALSMAASRLGGESGWYSVNQEALRLMTPFAGYGPDSPQRTARAAVCMALFACVHVDASYTKTAHFLYRTCVSRLMPHGQRADAATLDLTALCLYLDGHP